MNDSIVLTFIMSFMYVLMIEVKPLEKLKAKHKHYVGQIIFVDFDNQSFEVFDKKRDKERLFMTTPNILKSLKTDQMVKVSIEPGTNYASKVKILKKNR